MSKESERNNLLTSVKRTFVPIVVALLMSTFLGGYIPAAELQLLATSIVSTGYYVLARLGEKHVSPKFGLLLGSQAAPEYKTKASKIGNTVILPTQYIKCCCEGDSCERYQKVQ